jgi:hydrogenase-4 component F
MLVAVTTNNVGVMWVAIEATTIASALLVPLHRSRASIEASWKYLLIGSVGIAVAFAGTVLAYVDFVNTAGRADAGLSWTALRASAATLHPPVVQLAFVFILVGYGTKAGLAPMHTWLPDAHSEAPAPLSAMMSGVLLAVAVYGIARWKAVADAAVGPAFADRLLIILALLSLAVAAFSLVEQRQYKRMLAYSSVEHTGLTILGLALGPAGAFAAMLHLLGHTLAKSVLFLLAGRILDRYRSPNIADVAGLLRTMPFTGALFAMSLGAVLGLPPFGLFVSEMLLVRAGLADGRPWIVATALALVGVAFVALVRHTNQMLHGRAHDEVPRGEANPWSTAPLLLPIAGLVVLGLVMPAPVTELLARAVEALAP